MKSKKLWLGIGAVVLIVLCMGVAFLATQGKPTTIRRSIIVG